MKKIILLIAIFSLLIGCDNDIKVFKESKLATNSLVRVDTLFEKNPLFLSFQWDKQEPFGNHKRAKFTGYYDKDKLISLSMELIMPDPDSVQAGSEENKVTIRNARVNLTWPADSLYVFFPVDGDRIINEPVKNIAEIVKPDSLFDEIIRGCRVDILTVFQKSYQISDHCLLKNFKQAISLKQSKLFELLNGFKNAPPVVKKNLRNFYSLFMQYDTDLSMMNTLTAKYGYTFDSFPRATVYAFFQQAITSLNIKMADQLFKIRRYPPVASQEFKTAYLTAIQKNSLHLVKKFNAADPDIESNLIDHSKIINGIFGRSKAEPDLTALNVAAFYGNLEIVKFFYAKEPSRMNLNKTLACAAYSNKIKTVEFLLRKRVNPEVQFPEASAVEYARKVHSKNSAIYKLLAKYSKNE